VTEQGERPVGSVAEETARLLDALLSGDGPGGGATRDVAGEVAAGAPVEGTAAAHKAAPRKTATPPQPATPKTAARKAATPKTAARKAATPKTAARKAATPTTAARKAASPTTAAHKAARPKTATTQKRAGQTTAGSPPPEATSARGAAAPSPCPSCGQMAGDRNGSGDASVCHLCLVCQLITAVRSVNPETVERLADLAAAVSQTLRDVAADRWARSGRPSARRHGVPVEDIAVGEDDEPEKPADDLEERADAGRAPRGEGLEPGEGPRT